MVGRPRADVPTPQASMTPNQDLRSGETVVITGSGFQTGVALIITECQGTIAAPPLDASVCSGPVADTSTVVGMAGTFADDPSAHNGTAGYEVRATTQAPDVFPCDSAHPCVLYLGVQLDDFTQPHVFLPLNWAPAVVGTALSAIPPPPVAVPAEGSGNLGTAAISAATVAPASAAPVATGSPAAALSPDPASPTASSAATVSPAATLTPAADGTALANTGPGAGMALLAGLGVLAMVVGQWLRRRRPVQRWAT